MISATACQAFDNMLLHGFRPALAGTYDCHIEPLSDFQMRQDGRLVVINLSSYLFRMMIMISFVDDVSTRQHIARVNRKSVEELNDQDFLDALSEMANMGCGALSRNLLPVFPHIGMSTPNLLDWQCSEYLVFCAQGISDNSVFPLEKRQFFKFMHASASMPI